MKLNTHITALFVAVIAIGSLFSCNKQEDTEEENNTPVPIVNEVPGCYIQSMLASDLDFQYTFTYNTAFPTLLENYKSYNSTTGNVNESYRFGYHYHEGLQTVILDTVFKYLGDVDNMNLSNWYTATIYEYFFGENNSYYIDAARVYVNDPLSTEDGFLLKGTIEYEYDDYDLLTGVDYVDYADNTESGTEYDNYRMVILHDTEERLREIHYYNWNDVETYYEIHVPSAYYQPTQTSKSFHPDHGWLTRFAPGTSTYWTQGVGIATYNYVYQVNADNYVVEQTWDDGSNEYLISLYNYECYE